MSEWPIRPGDGERLGDYTWRYRAIEWLASLETPVPDFPESLKAALAPVREAFRTSHGDQLDGIEAAISGVVNDWNKLDEGQRDQCIAYVKASLLSLGAAVELAAKRAINEALRKHGGTAARVLLGAL